MVRVGCTFVYSGVVGACGLAWWPPGLNSGSSRTMPGRGWNVGKLGGITGDTDCCVCGGCLADCVAVILLFSVDVVNGRDVDLSDGVGEVCNK